MSISSADDTDTTGSDGDYDSELDPDVDMRMEDDVDAPDGVHLDGDVDMERDGADDEEKDEEKEDEEVVEEEDEDEEEDQDEDDGKEPWMLGQGEMVNISADDVDTMVDDKPIVLPEQGEEMREHTPRPQPPEPHPLPPTPETHPLSGLEHLGLVTPRKPRPVVPTLREAEAARNTSDVDVDVYVDQQLQIESAGGDSLPNVAVPNVPLPEPRLDGSVGEE